MAEDQFNALPNGFEFAGYRIESVLGSGGFGITYLARELPINRKVAIKEYLPGGVAMRGRNAVAIHPVGVADEEEYEWGLNRFLEEAQTLVRFHHPNIVSVLRFFEANGTAYMVMAYQEGDSLAARFARGGPLTEAALETILEPLLDGLAEVHRAGFLHRDIKPDNIYIRADGTPVLLDFGAARQALGVKSRSLFAVFTPGYAPFEQYYGSGQQGPWTDIYALGAVFYRAITREPLPEAPERVDDDPMLPAIEAGAGRYDPTLLDAIDRALAVRAADRPQDVDEWRRLFGLTPALDRGADSVAAPMAPDSSTPRHAGTNAPSPSLVIDRAPASAPALRWGPWAIAIVLMIMVGSAGAYSGWQYFDQQAARRAEQTSLLRVRAKAEVAAAAQRKAEALAEAQRKAKAEALAEAQRKAEAEALAEAQRKAKADALAEAQRKAEALAEAQRTEALAKRKADAEAAARHKAQAEARRKAAAKRVADRIARLKALNEARSKALAEATRKAAVEAARQKAAAVALRKAEEAAIQKAVAAAQRKAEDAARQKATTAARRRVVAAMRRRTIENTRRRAMAEAVRKAIEKARREARAKALGEARRAAAQRLQADTRLRAEQTLLRPTPLQRAALKPRRKPDITYGRQPNSVAVPRSTTGSRPFLRSRPPSVPLPPSFVQSPEAVRRRIALARQRGGSGWYNPATGNSGIYIPIEEFYRGDGILCRRGKAILTYGGKTSEKIATYCRDSHGRWQRFSG